MSNGVPGLERRSEWSLPLASGGSNCLEPLSQTHLSPKCASPVYRGIILEALYLTLMPSSMYLRTLATPLRRLKFDDGQCTTPA